MSLFGVLLFVHIVAAAVWIGGALVATLIGSRLRRAGDASSVAAFCTAYAQVGGPAFGGSGLLVLLTGMAMVGEGYPSFADLWVAVGFVGWIASMVIGGAVTGRQWFAIGQELSSGAVTLEQAQPRIRRVIGLTHADVLIRIVVVLFMVWRPTP